MIKDRQCMDITKFNNKIVIYKKNKLQLHWLFKRYYYYGPKIPFTSANIGQEVKIVSVNYNDKFVKNQCLIKLARYKNYINDHQKVQLDDVNQLFKKALGHNGLLQKSNIEIEKKYFSFLVLSSGQATVTQILPEGYPKEFIPFTMMEIQHNKNSTLNEGQAKQWLLNSCSQRSWIPTLRSNEINIAKYPILIPEDIIGFDVFIHELLPGSGYHKRYDKIGYNIEMLRLQKNILSLYQNPKIQYYDVTYMLNINQFRSLEDDSEYKKLLYEIWLKNKHIYEKY